jgi:NhaA family Na+:H+ antiporter
MLRQFLASEATGGILLMASAILALVVANSPVAKDYFQLLRAQVGPLNVQGWINDALMSAFFLLVGLEIKREMLEGRLASWDSRILPGAAAAGGMLVPAIIYVFFNFGDGATIRGWAIPSATDIAFALGVLSLFGNRIPTSLKVFLAALAIIDDLGAVLIIANFYTSTLNWSALAGAACIVLILFGLNVAKVRALAPYLVLGIVLWLFVFASGIHATLSGVMLAMAIPLKVNDGANRKTSPLLRLEHVLQRPVAFILVPLFGFANAGVSFADVSLATLIDPITVGVALGLLLGKLIGVLTVVVLLTATGLAAFPEGANLRQMIGVAFLCGIGFTMSLFVGGLAFSDEALQDQVKIGILLGSVASASCGSLVLARPWIAKSVQVQ